MRKSKKQRVPGLYPGFESWKTLIKYTFYFIRERYYGRGGMWSVGYFVSTVGLDEEKIKRYVRYQEKEDLGQAKLAI